MSAIPKKKRYTEAEYLELERQSLEKHEYFDGTLYAMAGASRKHNTITFNICGELYSQLKGSSCHAFSSDMRVKIPRTGLFTYPDVLIVCGEPEFLDGEHLDTLVNPQVVFEVLSKSTERYDREFKFQSYRTLDSMREYILVRQDQMLIEHYVRGEKEQWERDGIFERHIELVLTSVPVRLQLADIYRGVDLSIEEKA